jgi:hypothetical protein
LVVVTVPNWMLLGTWQTMPVQVGPLPDHVPSTEQERLSESAEV